MNPFQLEAFNCRSLFSVAGCKQKTAVGHIRHPVVKRAFNQSRQAPNRELWPSCYNQQMA